MERYYDTLKFTAFVVFAGSLTWVARRLSDRQKIYNQTKKLPVRSLREVQYMSPGEETFVKVVVASGPQIGFEEKIYTNQIYFMQPSDKVVLEKYRKHIQNNKYEWFVKDGTEKKTITKQVNNFGKVYGDVFSFARRFQEFQRGTLASIHQGIAFFMQFIVGLFSNPRKSAQSIHRKPIFSGPLAGILHYQVGLLTSSYIVLKCSLNDSGQLVASMTASSKGVILEQLARQMRNDKLYFVLLTIGAIISGKMVYRYLKIKYLQMKAKRVVDSGVYLNLVDLPDDKACIICYEGCRNAVFMDCRHCVICAGCSKVYKEDKCPICKHEIDSVKIIYNC